jgi:hypothetical protein
VREFAGKRIEAMFPPGLEIGMGGGTIRLAVVALAIATAYPARMSAGRRLRWTRSGKRSAAKLTVAQVVLAWKVDAKRYLPRTDLNVKDTPEGRVGYLAGRRQRLSSGTYFHTG